MECVLLTIVSLLAILGFVSMIKSLVFWFFKLPEEGMFLVTMLDGPDSAEETIRSVFERAKWMGFPARLVFTYRAGDTETQEIARRLMKEYPETWLMTEEELDRSGLSDH